MWKVIKRRWNYLVAKLSGRFEENADPKVQLEQAMAEAQEQHRRLVEQAASVIANQKQTELQLNRSMQELEKISSSTRQALSMADEAARRGDTAKAAEYNQTAEAFANRLIMSEKRVDDLKTMSLQSTQAALQAKAAVQQNANLLQQKLSERQKLVPIHLDGQEDTQPTVPWNVWDRFMFVLGLLGIVALIGFGVLNISFNLLESGFITFRENPIRSYLWAALLPVGALGVKIGWDVLQDHRQRAMYLWTCLAVGMIGVLVWMGAYACVYPTLSKGIDEQIAGLTVFDGKSQAATAGPRLNFAGAKWVDVVTVGGQAVAEIFLSAVIGMYLTSLYARHRPVRLGYDPAFIQLDTERRSLEESVARERSELGEATGNLVRLENQLSALIAYGKSMLHREAAKRQNQAEKRQVILDQLSDHLRHHLDSADGNSRLSDNTAAASLTGSNPR